MKQELALELKGITKTFGSVVANKDVSLQVNNGEILAILGENGSGKTTLMNMVSGIYYPDEGSIFVNGKEVVIRSPKDAFKYKIGMIHQHFKLVDVFTATENIVLGIKDDKKFNIKEAKKKVKGITDKYGFVIDLDKKIYEMSVSEKQTVEIIKVLYRGADILILDEPTAVLTPQETKKLFNILRRMEPVHPQERLIVKNLSVKGAENKLVLDDVSFTVRSGEIFGIAGISGCGQKELLEAIAGLQKAMPNSSIIYKPEEEEARELVGKSPQDIRKLGIALSFVPEDRLGMGLVGNMDIVDNMMLRSYKKGASAFLDRKDPKSLADRIIESLDVVTPNAATPVRRLSGGNVQKVLVGREISSNPKVLMVAYPVRGLDINSSYTIYNLLTKQKESGVAVIFVGEDLDVLVELCDRIMVINSGKITGIVDGRTAVKEEIGLLMTKSTEKEGE